MDDPAIFSPLFPSFIATILVLLLALYCRGLIQKERRTGVTPRFQLYSVCLIGCLGPLYLYQGPWPFLSAVAEAFTGIFVAGSVVWLVTQFAQAARQTRQEEHSQSDDL